MNPPSEATRSSTSSINQTSPRRPGGQQSQNAICALLELVRSVSDNLRPTIAIICALMAACCAVRTILGATNNMYAGDPLLSISSSRVERRLPAALSQQVLFDDEEVQLKHDDDDDEDNDHNHNSKLAQESEPEAVEAGEDADEEEQLDEDEDEDRFYASPSPVDGPIKTLDMDLNRDDIKLSEADFDELTDGKRRRVANSTASGKRGLLRRNMIDPAGSSRPAVASATRRQGVACIAVLSNGACLTFATIEWALRRARRRLAFREPARAQLESPEPSESVVHSVGELTEWTARYLAERFGLGWYEVSFELEQIDMSRTSLWRVCPLLYRLPPTCLVLTRYRTHSGQCNNLLASHYGSTNMPYARILPASYSDSISLPRRASLSGNQLPPVRLVALSLHPTIDQYSDEQSNLFMSWGQLINHDITMASNARDATGNTGSCCGESASDRTCMPIDISRLDPLYSRYGIRCHEFKRSLAGLRPGCSLGPRSQLNTVTSYVDASFIYGSTGSMSQTLRGSNERGQLEMANTFRASSGLKPLLPPQVNNPDEECVNRRGRFCFQSGDPRTNQQVQLVALHTIHARHHNRLAEALHQLNPHWSSNRIYHEARHIHIAQVQHILISEYLPALLGAKACQKYHLGESPLGNYWDHYKPRTNAAISQAFSAAAFRQGHSQVPSQVYRYSWRHEPLRAYRLRDLFRQPWPLYEPGAMDDFLLGMLDVPAQAYDPFISAELSGHLMQLPNEPVGFDLVSINIQRGRDQGLAGYNAYREWCGLSKFKSFGDMESQMSTQSVAAMASLYECVDDIDLFSGGMSEYPMAGGGQVGPTFACIIGHQFELLREGDRFWFESSMGPHAFTMAQLDSIKQTSLARLICANSDNVISIQKHAMKTPHPILNPRLHCNELPEIDIKLWIEVPIPMAHLNQG